MMHLKLNDGAAMLRNFYNSGSHFLLASNFPDVKVGKAKHSVKVLIQPQSAQANTELPEGRTYRYQMNNLHLHPFNLPPPLCQSAGDAEIPSCYIAAWQLDTLGYLLGE